MNSINRLIRHLRISWKNLAFPHIPSPPFLILFVNSICNLTCEHCFYWRNLNRRDDLTWDEIKALSENLGRVETLNLSGGEPFLRPEFSDICRMFIQNNRVEQIYVPTNAYFPDRTVSHVREALKELSLKLFAVEISLDGMAEFHNRFRGSSQSFQKAMETYDALAQLQEKDDRLRIHAVSTATVENMEEIRRLSVYLYQRCRRMDHHNIALIRGDRKNPSLRGPRLDQYRVLYDFVSGLWAAREKHRFGHMVEPLLQWAKIQTARLQRQVVPCRAGILSAVVYSNGDVSVCETHRPLGNLRCSSFREIWHSSEADRLRRGIRNKECYCTNEVFLWPSIVFQPHQLATSLFHARVGKAGRGAQSSPPTIRSEAAATRDLP
ncbi:MAG: radical SAM protein [Acidobacteria bacterium]|nr:radical SAM protein [Acidobacteriota bacterium]